MARISAMARSIGIPKASFGLCDRLREHCVELHLLGGVCFVVHPSVHTLQKCLTEFPSHGLVEREKLLEELLRHGHVTSLPEQAREVDGRSRRLRLRRTDAWLKIARSIRIRPDEDG